MILGSLTPSMRPNCVSIGGGSNSNASGSLFKNHRQLSTFLNCKDLYLDICRKDNSNVSSANLNNWMTINNGKESNLYTNTSPSKKSSKMMGKVKKTSKDGNLLFQECYKFMMEDMNKLTDKDKSDCLAASLNNCNAMNDKRKKRCRKRNKKNKDQIIIDYDALDMDDFKDELSENEEDESTILSSSPIHLSLDIKNCKGTVVLAISPPRNLTTIRDRLPSECESEDSFIVFQSQDIDTEDDCSEYTDSSEDDDLDEDETDESSDDDTDLEEYGDGEDVVDFISTLDNDNINAKHNLVQKQKSKSDSKKVRIVL